LRTFDASSYPVLERALTAPNGILIADTLDQHDWQTINEGVHVRSWLGVPLVSSSHILGLLSLCHTNPGHFSTEHLRVSGSLSIAAAAAIQNARLYEKAEIYSAELERRASDLRRAEQALEHSENRRRASEERFQKVFRSAPIALSVTSLAEGKFIDVNEAFERHFGFTRKELVGRTSTELGFWEDPAERRRLVDRLRRGARIRSAVGRFRVKSGELRATLYSAETIQLDGQACLLLVADDVPQSDPNLYN
jgi:PAS domain S-box-containing protein